SVPQYTNANTLPMDWARVERNARPEGISDATWKPTWAKYLTRVGTTYGGFIGVLGETATDLSRKNNYVFRVTELFRYAVNASFSQSFTNVSGQVFFKDVWHPIDAGVSVNMFDQAAQYGVTAETQADGTFSMERVPAGTYVLTVEGYSVAAPA